MKRRKHVSLSKILIVCLIIFIPVIIGIIALHKVSIIKDKSSKGGVYSSMDNSQVIYNQQDVNKLQQLEQNRLQLSRPDAQVKANLIKRGSPLAITNDYTITYDPKTDMFQAEITTISINDAQKEVVAWFVNHGMSYKAICELPLQFTLNDSIAQSLKGLDVVFNPLAPRC